MSDEKFALEQPEGTVLQILGTKPRQRATAPSTEDSSASRKKTTH
jgi:hypothetical protein